MRGSDLAKAMASAVDRIVSAREGTGALDRAIKAIVGTIGRFSGKDATSYLEWVESPNKGRNASVLVWEFEERFARLSALDEPSWIRVGSYCSSSRWTSGIGIKWAPYWRPKTG